MKFTILDRVLNKPDLGLLVLRLVFGVMITLFGVEKLMGGWDVFEKVGGAMGMFGITWQPALWGLLCALVETFGGIALVLGVFFRPMALLLFLNMVVATAVMWSGGPDMSSLDGISGWFQKVGLPLLFCVAFLALLLTGPGKIAVKTGGSRGSSKTSEK